MSKLSLDRDKIDQAKKLAEHIVSPVHHFIDRHSTFSIERSVLRLLGVSETLEENFRGEAPEGRYPLVNELLDKIGQEDLSKGAGYWFGLAAAHHPRFSPNVLARKIISGDISLGSLERLSIEEVDQACQNMLVKQLEILREVREHKNRRPLLRNASQPLRYVIVATGNIHEDILQAKAAAEMGADIIAVIRSTAQSLLDYVPEGETTVGYGGTFATQANFRLMRRALDESEKRLQRRIGLTNYSSGLCMPEIAILGALEGVDYLLNDAMYGILFRDINMKRNFVDQHFSRRICALSGITIMTGEDNYLTTAESFKYWYQVLASHFINQAFAKNAGLGDIFLSLGHAFEMDPTIEDSILYEWAQAQLVREIFPRSPIKFMPPTKHKNGDIFFSYLYDGMFNLAGVVTGQSIQLLGMHTEAIHNPFLQDRFLSLKNANYIFNAAKSSNDEIIFQPNGKIARRARQVLDDALGLLKKVKARGLFRAIEEGAFANVRRHQEGGKGLEGVFHKDRNYYTPLHQYLTPRAFREELGGISGYSKKDRHGRSMGFPARKAGKVSGRSGLTRTRGRELERGRKKIERKGINSDEKGKRQAGRSKGSQKGKGTPRPLGLKGKTLPGAKRAKKEGPRQEWPPVGGGRGNQKEGKEKVILLPPPGGNTIEQEAALQREFHKQQLEKLKARGKGFAEREAEKNRPKPVPGESESERKFQPGSAAGFPLPRRSLKGMDEKNEGAKTSTIPTESSMAGRIPERPPLPRRPLKTQEIGGPATPLPRRPLRINEEKREEGPEKEIKENGQEKTSLEKNSSLPRRPLKMKEETEKETGAAEPPATPIPSGAGSGRVGPTPLPRRPLKISSPPEKKEAENHTKQISQEESLGEKNGDEQ